MTITTARVGAMLGALAIVLFAASKFVPELLWPCAAAFWSAMVCMIIAFFQGSHRGDE